MVNIVKDMYRGNIDTTAVENSVRHIGLVFDRTGRYS
jgi:hypothetical protein